MDFTTKSLQILNPSSIPTSHIFFLFFLFFTFFDFSQSQLIPTSAPTSSPKSSQSSLRIAVSLSIASGVLVLTLILVMGCFAIRRFRSGLRKSLDFESGEKVLEESGLVRRFRWEEIETMTTRFARVIGSGGFSTVYHGLVSGGSGAFKIHTGSERLNRVFKQELDILLRLHHKNIVKLLGYCDDREEGALVFEYVPNGNLQEMLHGTRDCPKMKLPWRTRMSIAFQLARAIEYLHEQCSLQIVHGDIKSSNILLDEGLNVKLCDFGFAKMGFSSTIMPPSSTMKNLMMGSPGYTDPHYLRTGIASKKNDVYSFGVVVLELVTGLEAFSPEKGELLTSVVVPKLSSLEESQETMILQMVDPNLGGEFDIEEVKAMLDLSSQCLRQAHTLRPSATQILEIIGERVNSVDFLMSSPEKDSKLGRSLLN